jgi:hypothetical protein
MSYILDAIKKAETQRQIEQVPTLGSAVAFQPNNKSGIARKILLFLLVIAIIAVPLYIFREPVQIKASEGLERAQSWLGSMMESENASDSDESGALSEQERAAESMVNSLKKLESEPQNPPQPEVQTEAKSEPDPVQEPEPEPETVSKAIASPESIAPEDLAVLQKVSFTVISYSADSNKRFVMDGASILREGDAVEGYPIIAIRKNTVVVDVKGVLYEIRL